MCRVQATPCSNFIAEKSEVSSISDICPVKHVCLVSEPSEYGLTHETCRNYPEYFDDSATLSSSFSNSDVFRDMMSDLQLIGTGRPVFLILFPASIIRVLVRQTVLGTSYFGDFLSG